LLLASHHVPSSSSWLNFLKRDENLSQSEGDRSEESARLLREIGAKAWLWVKRLRQSCTGEAAWSAFHSACRPATSTGKGSAPRAKGGKMLRGNGDVRKWFSSLYVDEVIVDAGDGMRSTKMRL